MAPSSPNVPNNRSCRKRPADEDELDGEPPIKKFALLNIGIFHPFYTRATSLSIIALNSYLAVQLTRRTAATRAKAAGTTSLEAMACT
jgi:hypothetical protein